MKAMIRFIGGPAWLVLVLLQIGVSLFRKGQRFWGMVLIVSSGAVFEYWRRQDKGKTNERKKDSSSSGGTK